ncbi:hypothetical protein F5X98DRAFT_347785 [Xylaria grammica]|nr:hypothetical protein F5X98DRAFT_347785 [Xylaria grammica]
MSSSREAQSKARVRRLTRDILEMKDGVYQAGLSEVHMRKLLPMDYRALCEGLASDEELAGYFYDKLRYEYRPSTKGKTQFTVYRNEPFHNGMVEKISGHVRLWLNDLIHHRVEGIPNGRDGKRIIEIARKINPLGGTPIMLDGNQLYPDCSYRYGSAADTQYPNMVVEVAWSQKPYRLRERVRELIQKSGGKIRTVVGLNFHGTWRVWEKLKGQVGRPHAPRRGPVDAIVFRAVFDEATSLALLDEEGQPIVTETPYTFCNERGKVNVAQQLRLRLGDFVPEEVLRTTIKGKALRGVELTIDAQTLMGYYDDVLLDQKVFDDNYKHDKGNKKRKRDVEN